MTDLQTELTALIAAAWDAWLDEGDVTARTDGPVRAEDAFIAERLASAFQQVGWSCSHCGPSKRSRGSWCDLGCGRDYNRMEPVYRFVRPESVEPKESNQ